MDSLDFTKLIARCDALMASLSHALKAEQEREDNGRFSGPGGGGGGGGSDNRPTAPPPSKAPKPKEHLVPTPGNPPSGRGSDTPTVRPPSDKPVKTQNEHSKEIHERKTKELRSRPDRNEKKLDEHRNASIYHRRQEEAARARGAGHVANAHQKAAEKHEKAIQKLYKPGNDVGGMHVQKRDRMSDEEKYTPRYATDRIKKGLNPDNSPKSTGLNNEEKDFFRKENARDPHGDKEGYGRGPDGKTRK